MRILDEDHIDLFQIFKRIEAMGDLGQPVDLNDLNQRIDELMEHAIDHCAREERIMREVGYPEARSHTLKHDDMKEYFIEILRPLVAGEIRTDVFVRLARGYFIKHFMVEDHAFVAWARDGDAGTD